MLYFLLTWGLPMILLIGFGQFMSKKMMDKAGGPNSMMFGLGKSNAKIYVKSSEGIKFSDVAGEDEAKESLTEIVQYLHDPAQYKDIGARMPKGILLVGPPGTGKTMLAKAVAGEANVPFFSMSGSEFVEMFVGMGASKVRDLFDQAKQKALPASSLSMRSTPSAKSVTDSSAATMSVNRPSTSCSPKWTALRTIPASSFWLPPTVLRLWTRRCCVPVGSTAVYRWNCLTSRAVRRS